MESLWVPTSTPARAQTLSPARSDPAATSPTASPCSPPQHGFRLAPAIFPNSTKSIEDIAAAAVQQRMDELQLNILARVEERLESHLLAQPSPNAKRHTEQAAAAAEKAAVVATKVSSECAKLAANLQELWQAGSSDVSELRADLEASLKKKLEQSQADCIHLIGLEKPRMIKELQVMLQDELQGFRWRLESIASADIPSLKALRESTQGLQLKMDAMWTQMQKMVTDGNEATHTQPSQASLGRSSSGSPRAVLFPSVEVDVQLQVQLTAAEAQIRDLVIIAEEQCVQLDELKQRVASRDSGSSFMEELQRSLALQVKDALASQMQDAASRQEACLQEALASQMRDVVCKTLLQEAASTKLAETSTKLEDRQGRYIEELAPSHELMHLRSCPSPNVRSLAVPSVIQVPTSRQASAEIPPQNASPLRTVVMTAEAPRSEVPKRVSLTPVHVMKNVADAIPCRAAPPPLTATQRLRTSSPPPCTNSGRVSPLRSSCSPGRVTYSTISQFSRASAPSRAGPPSSGWSTAACSVGAPTAALPLSGRRSVGTPPCTANSCLGTSIAVPGWAVLPT